MIIVKLHFFSSPNLVTYPSPIQLTINHLPLLSGDRTSTIDAGEAPGYLTHNRVIGQEANRAERDFPHKRSPINGTKCSLRSGFPDGYSISASPCHPILRLRGLDANAARSSPSTFLIDRSCSSIRQVRMAAVYVNRRSSEAHLRSRRRFGARAFPADSPASPRRCGCTAAYRNEPSPMHPFDKKISREYRVPGRSLLHSRSHREGRSLHE